MLLQSIRFLNLLMAGILSGTMFGILIGFNPVSLSAPAYLEHQKMMIHSLNTLMPVLGLMTIILTLVSAYLQRNNRRVYMSLAVAAILLIISGLITRFGNQPINSIVLTWNAQSIPDSWIAMRDKWWTLHTLRTVCTVLAFIIIIITDQRRHKINLV